MVLSQQKFAKIMQSSKIQFTVEIDGNYATTRFVELSMTSTRWDCLPDTIDPRGPKGK
jgi:hypothetical protein